MHLLHLLTALVQETPVPEKDEIEEPTLSMLEQVKYYFNNPSEGWDALVSSVLKSMPMFLEALATLFIGLWIAKMVAKGVRKGLGKSKFDDALSKFLAQLVKMGLTVIVLISALGALNVNTTSLVAVVGAAGLAVGFALQGSLGNFAAGIMLMIFRPFKSGDFIEAAGHAGVVEEITIFITRMRTGDNKQILVPNGEVMGSSITNYSAKSTRRIDLVVGISYDDDIKKAHQVLNRILDENELVLKDPAWTVAVSELGDNSVNFVVRPWVKTADYWNVYFGLTETIKLTFDQEGLSFPYPQRDVHMHQAQTA